MTDIDSLIAQVRGSRGANAPTTGLDRLADAVVLAASLNERADSLVDHFVEEARREGATWADIGGALGVTRQAAQQRSVRPLEALRNLADKAFGMHRFTARARLCVAAAVTDARDHGAPEVTVGHLVIGLLDEPRGVAASALHDVGLSDAAVVDAVRPFTRTPRAGAEPTKGRPEMSPAAHDVFKRSVEIALDLHHNYIGTEHLLLAALRDVEMEEAFPKAGAACATIEDRVHAILDEMASEKRA